MARGLLDADGRARPMRRCLRRRQRLFTAMAAALGVLLMINVAWMSGSLESDEELTQADGETPPIAF